MERGVSILNTYAVRPAVATRSQHLFLSSLDIMWRVIHYNQRVLFYESRTEEFFEIVQCLRQSLAAALVHFYPWAGRLIKGNDGRFVINCNDAGVEFVEASIDVSFRDMGEDFQPQPFFKQLAQLDDVSGFAITDIPLLSVQVTSFLDGGIALGISQSHVVADGYSLWHFMVSWGECARGIPVSNPPLHDRTLLKLQFPSPEKAREPFKFKQHIDEEDFKPKNLVERVFHFNGTAINRLKKMAADNATRSFTSYETLCAHCWKHVTAARRLQPQDAVHITVLANCRTRVVPPLPDNYFGNAIDNRMALTTAGELLDEGLNETAARIRQTIENFTDMTIRETMHWLELRDNLYPPFIFDSVGMLVASSPKFPVYDVDFGWGRAAAVRAPRLGGEGEICLFVGSEGRGSVDVCIKLGPQAMELLKKDSLFLVS